MAKQHVIHPTVPDLCASCDRPLKVKFRHWLDVSYTSTWSLVICGNYCSKECREFGELEPDEVAERLRQRILDGFGFDSGDVKRDSA